jgi:phosphoglycerate dehydrogenase-like enzyme
MKYSSDKDVNKYAKQLVQEGWGFKRGKKHGKLTAPGRRGIVVVPTSPSSARAVQELAWAVRNL